MSDIYNVARVLLSVLDSGENIYRHSGEHSLLRAALAQQAEPVREWQFLSAEERYRIADESASTIVAVLATEAALKEKNHG